MWYIYDESKMCIFGDEKETHRKRKLSIRRCFWKTSTLRLMGITTITKASK